MKFTKTSKEKIRRETNLSRSDDDIVNRNEDQVDEKSDKSHHDETNCRTYCYFSEFCVKIVAAIHQNRQKEYTM